MPKENYQMMDQAREKRSCCLKCGAALKIFAKWFTYGFITNAIIFWFFMCGYKWKSKNLLYYQREAAKEEASISGE